MFEKFNQNINKTQVLFQEISSQSTNISYCVIETVQSQVMAHLQEGAILSFLTVPQLPKLCLVPSSLLFQSLCNFLPPLLGDSGAGVGCEATLSSCVDHVGQAVMAHPLVGDEKRRQHRHQSPHLREGRYTDSVTSSSQRLSLRVLFLSFFFSRLGVDC